MRNKNLVSLFVMMLVVVVASGCAASGHRKTTIKIFGNELVVEDQVFPNHEGKNEYRSGIDPESVNLIKWFASKDENGNDQICRFRRIENCEATPGEGIELVCWELICVNPTTVASTETEP